MPFCGEIFLYFRGLQVPRKDKNFFPWIYWMALGALSCDFLTSEIWRQQDPNLWLRQTEINNDWLVTRPGRSRSDIYPDIVTLVLRYLGSQGQPSQTWSSGFYWNIIFNLILFSISPAAATTESDEGEAGRGAGEGRPGHSRQRSEVSRQILLAGIVAHFLSHWQ